MNTTDHQLASASLVGIFVAVLFIAAHVFADYRAAKFPSFQRLDVVRFIPSL
jgi:hypothetical protein